MHTKGPWRQDQDADDHIFAGVDVIAIVVGTSRDPVTGQGEWTDQDSANGRLIAAAPELLEVVRQASQCQCRALLPHDGPPHPWGGQCAAERLCWSCAARALLARVEG